MSRIDHLVAVVGASGGLGASTLALAVGHRLAATGPPSVVLDLDLDGGGLDVVAGIEHLPGRRWPGLTEVRGPVPPGPLLEALPGEDRCRVLAARPAAGPVAPGAVRDVLAAVATGPGPVVVDVPRGSGHLLEIVAVAGLVVVLVGMRTRALADADALVERVVGSEEAAAVTRLVTRGPRPGPTAVLDVEAHLGAEHLAHARDDPAVVRTAEHGLWPGSVRDESRRVADLVARIVQGRALGVAS